MDRPGGSLALPEGDFLLEARVRPPGVEHTASRDLQVSDGTGPDTIVIRVP